MKTNTLPTLGVAVLLAGITSTAMLSAQPCTAPPLGLVAWWSGDGHCFDIVSTNHGTPAGGVTFVPGKVGQSFSFDGTSGYVSVPGAGLSLGTGDFSVEGWAQTTATKTYNTLVSFDTYAPGIFIKGNGRLHLYGAAESTNAGFNDGQWHHFAVVRQTNAITYFKDGAPAGTTTYVNAINPTTFLIAHDYDGGDRFAGLIDEVALYNRALAPSEIAAIYAAGSAGKCKALKILLPPQNAIAYLGLSNAPMSVIASGTGLLTYQWQHGGTNLPGQINATLMLTNAQSSDGGNYTVVVSDTTASSVTSAPPAVLTMANLPVTITSQPTDQFASMSGTVTLNVAAFGTPPLSYQWRRNGAVLPTATSATLTIPNVQMTNAGCYDVIVTNIANAVTSQVAVVSVWGPSSTVFTTTTLIDTGDMSYDGQDIVISACAVTMNGPHTFHSVFIVNGGVVTHSSAATNQPDNRLNLTITQDLLIDATSRIDVTGKGYHPGFSGPGAGASLVGTTWDDWGGGGGYGGCGAASSVGLAGGMPYGSITQPTDWGSDGGSCPSHAGVGGAGGGAVRVVVGGTLAVNGQILSKGTGDSTAPGGGGDWEIGGGSGGSIWLTAAMFTGHGTVSAEGGNADTDFDSGGGSGGRIAVYYSNNNFAGVVSACASGISSFIGGAGTIYTKASTQTVGDVLVDNGGNFGAMTLLTSPEPFNLTIANSGQVYSLSPLVVGSLRIATNGILTHLTGQTGVVATVQGDAVIDLGGAVTANGKGYPIGTNAGPGTGVAGPGGGGGSYGGLGGASYSGAGGGPIYGSILQPTDLGSQGGSGNGGVGGVGGGAIRLTVGGVLNVNGTLSAKGLNGINNNSGGGAGGSVWLTVGSLAGTGTISVNGGIGEAGADGGGGGGGHVAVYYGVNNFAGAMTAWGGSPEPARGGAGTIYTKASAQSIGAVLVDNGGSSGALTPLISPEAFSLTLSNQARVYPIQPITLHALHVATNTLLTHLTGQGGFAVTVQGDAVIDPGGSVNADGKGYPIGGDHGPGVGSPNYCCGGGGGYGGEGGVSYAGGAGGAAYGSLLQPTDFGSQGGSGYGVYGGAGGGAMRLTVNGTLTVNGQISANGLASSANNGGGGAGGSLWLTAGILEGSGSISVNGGNGEDGDGGGGGGGRIVLYYGANNFLGLMTGWGGGGSSRGGAGSIYAKATGQPVGDLVFDNGGSWGALAPFTTPEAFNLFVRNGAQVYPRLGQPLTLTSLDIGALGQLMHINGQKLNVTVLNQAFVRSNGFINVNGQGYPVGNYPGPGAGANGGDTGSGGGYGGVGGVSYNAALGGTAYGSSNAPTDWGSAGGGADGLGGSAGGGAIRLNVAGALTVDGTISANGAAASFNDQGNPSGGSVWLNAASLSGSGAITANGGPGNTYGGGGGGGRVAIYSTNQAFAGVITTAGGRGWHWGTNGTVFFGNYVTNSPPAVLALSPSGPVARWVDSVEATFSTAVEASTFMPVDVVFTTPSGVVPTAQIAVTPLTPQVFRISFPQQISDGVYTLQLGPAITSTLGQPMSSAYSGQFTIQWPRSISLALGTNTLHLAWPTEVGFFYLLQTSPDLMTWSNVSDWVAGNGVPLQVTFPTTNAPHQFFRMKLAN